VDLDGDGLADAVVLTASRGNKAFHRIFTGLMVWNSGPENPMPSVW
jgi:hypothetical protein